MPADNYSWLDKYGNDSRPATPSPPPPPTPPPAPAQTVPPAAPWLAPTNPQSAPVPPRPPDRLEAELLATQPPEQRETFHVDKHERRGRRRIALLVVVVIGAILALNQFTGLGNQTRIRALDPGDCIQMPDIRSNRYVSRVDCTELHDAEVVGHISPGVDDRFDECANMLATLHPITGDQLPGDAQVSVLTGALLDRCVVHSPTTSWTGSALGPAAAGN